MYRKKLWGGDNLDWFWWWMISLAVLTAIFIAIFYGLSKDYYRIINLINNDYNSAANKHFFISFRKQKRSLLYSNAERRISRKYPEKYNKFVIADYCRNFAFIFFIVSLYGSIGKGAYEYGWPWLKNEFKGTSDIEVYENLNDLEEYVEEDDGTHHVDSHYVEGYERSDGTEVDGYWRGGEDGYERSDPDDSLDNNLYYDTGSAEEDDNGFIDNFVDIFN
jgi:hypothetical protein